MLETQFLGIPLYIWILLAVLAITLIAYLLFRFLKNNWLLIAAISCMLYFNRLCRDKAKKPIVIPIESEKKEYFHYTILYFKEITAPISIVGVIITIATLIPLFLTFFLGSDWIHILLTQTLGIQILNVVIFITYASSIFIYFILALILVIWINQILINSKIHIGEKIFSLVILTGFICIMIGIIYFLSTIWYTRLNIPADLFGFTWIIILFFGLAFTAIISGFIFLSGEITAVNQQRFKLFGNLLLAACVIFLSAMFIVTVLLPAISSNIAVYNISTEYANITTKNTSFQIFHRPEVNGTPLSILIQPDLSRYIKDDVNSPYTDCHWSTTYGYFITVDKNLFVKKESNDFTLSNCPENDTTLYWTYAMDDYSKNKRPFIISLQIENSNERSAHESLGEGTNYIVGDYHLNFTWVNQTYLTVTNDSIF